MRRRVTSSRHGVLVVPQQKPYDRAARFERGFSYLCVSAFPLSARPYRATTRVVRGIQPKKASLWRDCYEGGTLVIPHTKWMAGLVSGLVLVALALVALRNRQPSIS